MVQVGTQSPVVGKGIAMIEEPDGARAASYRVLRHHLPLRDDNLARVTMVSSARAGESTTRSAINLAMALNDYHRRRVLLIDANFARPSVVAALELRDAPCFATQLTRGPEQAMSPWTVAELAPSQLHVLPLRTRPETTRPLGEAAYASAFCLAMQSLREAGYEHIVVAAPPVLESAQPTLMQDATDGVVLACRRGESRAKHVQRSVEVFGRDAVLGLVLDLG